MFHKHAWIYSDFHKKEFGVSPNRRQCISCEKVEILYRGSWLELKTVAYKTIDGQVVTHRLGVYGE